MSDKCKCSKCMLGGNKSIVCIKPNPFTPSLNTTLLARSKMIAAGAGALESAAHENPSSYYEEQLRKSQQEVARVRDQLSESIRMVNKYRKDAEVSKQELDSSRRDVDFSRRALDASRQELDASRRELNASTQSINIFRQELETSQTNFTRLQRDSATTIERVTQQYTDASRRCRDVEQRSWDQIRQIGELTREMEAARQDVDAIKHIQSMSASLVRENHGLREQVFEMQRIIAESNSATKASQVEKNAECMFCMSDPPVCYVRNCGHLISCKDCARDNTLFTCPICRQDENTELIETTGITNCQCGNPSNMVCETCQHISMCKNCCSHHQSCSACGTTGGKFKQLFA